MRVIAGTHRGRRLVGPRGEALRPTSDRVREALGSILSHRIAGCRFLDLYAGTGAVGIEALSRGAIDVTYVESNATALALLRRNIAGCGLMARTSIRSQTVQQFLSRPESWGGPFDLVFADPPYESTFALTALMSRVDPRLFAPDACLVVEHARKTILPAELGGLEFVRRYDYGDTALSLFGETHAGSS